MRDSRDSVCSGGGGVRWWEPVATQVLPDTAAVESGPDSSESNNIRDLPVIENAMVKLV